MVICQTVQPKDTHIIIRRARAAVIWCILQVHCARISYIPSLNLFLFPQNAPVPYALDLLRFLNHRFALLRQEIL